MSTLHWFLIVAFFIIILLHAASAFLKCSIAKLLNYVNMGLHIVVILMFLLAEVSLDAVALCFMSDLLVYVVLNILAVSSEKRREGGDDL